MLSYASVCLSSVFPATLPTGYTSAHSHRSCCKLMTNTWPAHDSRLPRTIGGGTVFQATAGAPISPVSRQVISKLLATPAPSSADISRSLIIQVLSYTVSHHSHLLGEHSHAGDHAVEARGEPGPLGHKHPIQESPCGFRSDPIRSKNPIHRRVVVHQVPTMAGQRGQPQATGRDEIRGGREGGNLS